MKNYKWLNAVAIILFVIAAVALIPSFIAAVDGDVVHGLSALLWAILSMGSLISGFICLCTKIITGNMNNNQ